MKMLLAALPGARHPRMVRFGSQAAGYVLEGGDGVGVAATIGAGA